MEMAVPRAIGIWICLLLLSNCFVNCSFSSEKLLAELQLADMELADSCEAMSKGLKSGVLQGDFKDKIVADKKYGNLLRTESKNLKEYDDVPDDPQVQRNLALLTKPGDGLLHEEDWNTLVSYHNTNEELESVVKVPCTNNTDGCLFTKGEYQSILKNSKDVDLLNATWYSWQHVFTTTTDQYGAILDLAKKAASRNEMESVTSYWEFLNDFNGAYSSAKQFWDEVKPFYSKLHGFVRNRLNNYYKINESSEIPVFLLGSNFGKDWSYIANIILPHPQLHYDAETFLKYKKLPEIYKLAENLTQTTSLGALGEMFWSNSKFDMPYCQPHIFSFCSQEYSEVYDCNETSWITYLDAHETAFKIALRNQDYLSLMRLNLKYSAIDEAVAALGPLLAIENIHYHGISTVADDDSVKMTKLLLAALRFLPQLPYYLAADEWRLQELEVSSANPASYRWKIRNEYQGVKGVTGVERDFLRDSLITSNKPYISKFFGIILAFQFVQYYRDLVSDPNANIALEFGSDSNFQSMLKERLTEDWQYIITMNYNIELSTASLLEYFKPLEQYFEEAPLQQAPIVTTTTTTTTTSTTTAPPTTKATVEKMELMELNESQKPEVVQNDEPKVNSTIGTPANDQPYTSNLSMYVGVGLLIFVSCLLVAVFGYRHIKKHRRRTNNRRFES